MNNFAMLGYHNYFGDRHWSGFVILLTILFLAFEIWMLVDVIQNRKVPKVHKIWWVIGMFLIHPFVAIIYFFVSRFSSAYKK